MLHRNHLRERRQRVCQRLEILDVNLHTLRHTCASHLVMAGVDLPTIAKVLGQTDIKTTMIYSHLAGDHIRQAVGRISLRFISQTRPVTFQEPSSENIIFGIDRMKVLSENII